MPEEKKYVSLSPLLRTETTIRRLLTMGETVLCVHRKSRKTRLVPFKALFQNDHRFWLNPGSVWEYYISQGTASAIGVSSEDSVARVGNIEVLPEEEEKSSSLEESDPLEELEEVNFGSDYERIERIPIEKRTNLLLEFKKRLDELAQKKGDFTEEKAEALVTTSRDAALINRATLIEALRLGDEEARQYTQGVINATREMVKTTTRLVNEEIFQNELVKRLIEQSNGTVVQHMTRVFLNGLSFLSFYNHQVQSTSLANRIRIQFPKRYHRYYRPLLPHLHEEDIVLERVFYKGMQAVPELEFQIFATGFLIHDIGKAEAIEYHEGESGYDRNIIVEHVKIGYQAIMNKTSYPRQTGLIAGYHHEYYGDATGYGYFREYLDQYRRANPKATLDYCMTYELEPILDYQALAYFPAKVLEIVDIFDSLTDPNRKYRKPLEEQEALEVMKKEFIDDRLRIDPILFDLFKDFLQKTSR